MNLIALYFSFRGRIGRTPFWLGYIVPWTLISLFLAALEQGLGLGSGNLTRIWLVVSLWPFLAVSAKRYHDLNKSGWRLVLFLIPIVQVFYLIWYIIDLGFLRGTEGDNRFGLDPKSMAISDLASNDYLNRYEEVGGNSSAAQVETYDRKPSVERTKPVTHQHISPNTRLEVAKELFEEGVLTDAEYNILKQRLSGHS